MPIVFTTLPLRLTVVTQALPFQIKALLLPDAMTLPYIVKLAVPVLLTNAMRPAVVLVGVGNVRVWLAVVCATLNTVYASTVTAAVPMLPPPATSLIVCAVNKVLPWLIKLVPVPTVSPPVAVVKPVTPSVPPIVALLVTLSAVPAALKVFAAVNVFAPASSAKPQALLF